MANHGRKLGINIFTLMQNAGISREEVAQRMNYSYRDICRVLEGRLVLPPSDMGKLADLLGVTKHDLLHYEADKVVPELQYMKEFSDADKLDEILDLLDEYVELKESV